ncbi:uncharacterized protein CTRU02_212354 [Colletotrichum truncatum]|uniref:Uncharacterized protein n=1 Tax=Colletotrichum truncatum TaxID=5467 RepID=A0ACC3YNB3_COLTU|nr:uncharacterized protein CTRU02_08767 [Colletotrichum truncatum]KAF6789520.1 hypothetical protein CTRU02_08767 [Colletotrichum truncatum]
MKLHRELTMESTSQLENLPTEILLHILTHFDDIHCLWNLIASSPASYRVFSQYKEEIFWHALLESNIPLQTQEIIRFVIQLRAGAFKKTNFDEVIAKIKEREAGIVLGSSEELGYDFPTKDSSAVPSLRVLRSILCKAAQIHCLSRSCIDWYMQQLIVAKSNGRVTWDSDNETATKPSWIEEQRVIRAFWRLQLIFELESAVQASQLRFSSQNTGTIDRLNIRVLYDSTTSNLKAAYNEVMTVVEYLQNLESNRKQPVTLHNRLPSPVWSLKDITPSTLRMPATTAMRKSALVLPTDGLWIVDSLSRGVHSPIKYSGFDPYRQMGFAIWDRHRIAKMGLVSPPGQGRVTGLGSYFPQWLQLLSGSDLARAEEIMQHVEEQGERLVPLQPVIQDNAS